MQIYVGTSGWLYDWNIGRSLEWYVKNSGLNSIELNMSFYRYPTRKTVEIWAEKGKTLRWSIKASRLITHVYRFGEKAETAWNRFKELFSPIEEKIDYYLFQLPPSMTPRHVSRIERFILKTELGSRLALEWRSPEWFREEWIRWAIDLGITPVSIDAPELPRTIFKSGQAVYLRMHGRYAWYSHDYTDEELKEVAESIVKNSPGKVHVYFNNNHAMLRNARRMLKILIEEASAL